MRVATRSGIREQKTPRRLTDRHLDIDRLGHDTQNGVVVRLASLRASAGARCLAALLAVFVWAGTADWGHVAWDDPACDPAPVYHDHSAHRFTAGTADDQPSDGHCYLCHSLRLLHTGLTVRSAPAPRTDVSSPYRIGVIISPNLLVAGARLSRAPPVVLL
jgi:hypothetical protein